MKLRYAENQALALAEEHHDPADQALTYRTIGEPDVALGQHGQARAAWREALELYRREGRDAGVDRVRRQLDTLDSR
jgi:predicted negative regulator of RcsB-dependent stress response